MWRGVERLAAGHYLVIERGVGRAPVRYHRHRIGGAPPRPKDETDATTVALLEAAIQRQLVADVPVGIFLSGGIDSSLIAAVASRLTRDLPCHTIQVRSQDGARDPMDDDTPYAKRVAEHFGLPLRVHTIEPNATELLPRLLRALDEPTGDPAVMLSFLIADAARPTTKVLLSGMGADEVAGGYRRHIAAHWSRAFYRLPQLGRDGAGRAAQSLASLLGVVPVSSRPHLRRVQKALGRLPGDVHALPEALASWLPPALSTSLLGETPGSVWPRVEAAVSLHHPIDPLEACLAFDVSMYLPSHNLFYVDKTTMAASVEVRVPFLDNALSEHLMALPTREKVAGTTTKLALRRAAARLVPPEIIRRPKTGFGAPIRSWLRGELRPMLMDLLAPSVVRSRGLLDPAGVQRLLTVFERDSDDVSYPLWHLLMLELWCREVIDARAGQRVPLTT
jgi:asparagine synthase (glutamine-hydrolysing)